MTNPCETLRISKDASMEEIKDAYRTMIKLYHPDRYVNVPEMKKIAEEKTREIIEAYHYLMEHFEDNPFRTETATAESATNTSDERTYNGYDGNQDYTYHSTNEKTYDENYQKSTRANENVKLLNGQAITAFVFGMISVFLILLSPVFFSISLTLETSKSIPMGMIFYVILPILVIIFFVGVKRGENYAGSLTIAFFSSFILLLLAPILKLILVSSILLTAPIFSIIYGVKGWSEVKWIGSGMILSTIGFFSGMAVFVLFVLHFTTGITL